MTSVKNIVLTFSKHYSKVYDVMDDPTNMDFSVCLQ